MIEVSEVKETTVRCHDGNTRVTHVFEYYDRNGVRKRSYGNNRARLEAKREKLIKDLIRGEEALSDDTFQAFAQKFLEYRQQQIGLTINDMSYNNDERHLRIHLIPFFGVKKLEDIKVVDVNLLLIHLQKKGLAPKTQRHVINTGLRMMKHAKACQLVRENVFGGDDREQVVGPNGTRDGYTHDEAQAILTAEKDMMYKAIWHVAAFTGLSASELAGLQWGDLNMQRGSVTVNRAAIRYAYNPDNKTPHRKRTLALPPRTLTWLREWKIACPAGEIAFPSSIGGIPSQDTWRKHLKRTCKKAGVTYKGIGGFRNFFCTSMENSNVPKAIRNYRMGHSKHSSVADVHYTDVDMQKAISAADATALEASLAP